MELLVEEATRNQTPWNNTELDYTSDLGGFPKCHDVMLIYLAP